MLCSLLKLEKGRLLACTLIVSLAGCGGDSGNSETNVANGNEPPDETVTDNSNNDSDQNNSENSGEEDPGNDDAGNDDKDPDQSDDASTPPDSAIYSEYKLYYSHGSEYGDSVLFSPLNEILVSGGLDQNSLIQIKPNLHTRTLSNTASLPVGMAYDSQGNFYFSNCLADSIERITPSGEQQYFATVTQCPASIVINDSDELFVTSFNGNRIDRVSNEGNVSTLVSSNLLENPVGLTFDDNNTLYVANWSGGKLFQVDGESLIEVANFNTRVNQIAYADGYVYAPLRLENRIDRTSLQGDIQIYAANEAQQPLVAIENLNGPYGVAISEDKQTLAVVERDAGRVFTLSIHPPQLITQQHIDDVYASEKMLGRQIVHENFEAPQLSTSRTVRVYLPVEYDQNNQHYPVVYMQDGHEVFLSNANNTTSSWRVDQSMDEYAWLDLHPGAIVVAVDATATRAQEYIPYPVSTEDFTISESRSDDLARFMVDTLKPFIDTQYRTQQDRESTYIVGASFGAFFSLYAAFEYPETFGNIGVFSPALWYGLDEVFFEDISDHDTNYPMRTFIYASNDDETNAHDIYNTIVNNNFGNAELYIDPLGAHNQSSWSHAFWNGMLWLLNDYPHTEAQRLEHPNDWHFSEPDEIEGYLTEGSGEIFPPGPITFTFEGDVESVRVIGAWNGWDPAAANSAMELIDGLWTTTIDIPAGEWAFGISIDGAWVNPLWSTVVEQFSPEASDLTPGSFGGFDAVLHVEEASP